MDSAVRETLIRAQLAGEYKNPVRIVSFNTTEGWSRDVTVEVADELRRRFVEYDEVPEHVLDFMTETAADLDKLGRAMFLRKVRRA